MAQEDGDFQDNLGSYGSYTATQGSFLGAEASLNSDDGRARILLMGPRRSGKSSIQKVVFHKMSPHETLFLESTNDVRMKDISTSALVQFQLLDFPGNFDFSDKKSKITPEKIFKRTAAAPSNPGAGSGGAASTVLVFVIDAQDDETYSDAYEHFINLARLALKVNPKIEFDVLIHKVDGDAYASEDHKTDCQRDIIQAITDELADAKLNIRPTFHMTSIYDHTIFEAFSKIVQKLIPHFSVLEKLLDSLIASCGIEKTFLFDVVSKIYVATDSNPVDMQTYELCSDMIDVVIDVSCIYGTKGKGDVLSYDADSASVITLSNNYILYLREVNKYLALVCMMPADSFSKAGLVEYNFLMFKKAITQLFEAKLKSKLPSGLPSAGPVLGSSVMSAAAGGDAKDMKTAPAAAGGSAAANTGSAAAPVATASAAKPIGGAATPAAPIAAGAKKK